MKAFRVLFNLRKVLRNPGTPLWVKLVPFFAIAYLLLPVDVIPDPIPVLGLLDDLVILVTLASQAIKKLSENQAVLDQNIPQSIGYRP
jgi:uncharacterized membrane protein YkvA (DUF1232 family)